MRREFLLVLLTGIFLFSGIADAQLVGEYFFNEGTGTTVYDSSTYKINGTITGATWKNSTDCVEGNCLWFDGSNDYVSIPYSTNQNVGNFTLEMWVYYNSTSDRQPLWQKSSSSPTIQFLSYTHDSYGHDLACVVWDSGGSHACNIQSSSNYIPFDNWTYFACSLDTSLGRMVIYKNGASVRTCNFGVGTPIVTGSAWNIGNPNFAFQNWFRGKIDVIRLWNETKDSSYILQSYQNPSQTSNYTYGNCMNINSAGTYTLSNDIISDASSLYPCINISASNVVLDLNGHTIWGCGEKNKYGSCSSWGEEGILIYSYNITPSENITIKNGGIVGFPYGINIYSDYVTVKNVAIITGDIGIHASGIQGLNITDSNITLPNTGMKLSGVIDSNIRNTWIMAGQYGIYGSGLDTSNITRINIYSQMIDTTIQPYCFNAGESDWGQTCIYPVSTNSTYNVVMSSGVGIWCHWCENSSFIGNLIATEDDGLILNYTSDENTIGNSIFYNPEDILKGLFLTPPTYNNTMCNIIGHIKDYGANNTYNSDCPEWVDEMAGLPLTPCNPNGTVCITPNVLGRVDVFCNIVSEETCIYGCNYTSNSCNPEQYSYPVHPRIPVNTTPLVPNTSVFFSPFFLINIMIFGVAGSVGFALKSGTAFIVTLILLMLTVTFLGYYPLWILFIFIIFAGLIFAFIMTKVIGGGH